MPDLGSYVPRLSTEWDLDGHGTRWRELDATCCFVDISGFTALSERLARRGRIGAEELTEVLNHVFSRMLGVAYSKGGALLKFGGDALLLAFTRDDHAVLAAQAAVAMRAALREARTLPTSVGRVNLKMSVGVHSGQFNLFRVGTSHQELLITGPAASVTTRMEQIAEAGEIVVSADTAARLPRAAVGDQKGAGWLLKWRRVVDEGPEPVPPRNVPAGAVESCIPVALRPRLIERSGESEHRLASVGFVKFQGVDDLIASDGIAATAEALHQVVTAVQQSAVTESVTFLASDIDANGGKIILVSGVPTTREDDEGRLLRTARAIVEQPLPLPVRIGVNRGHVFSGDIGTHFRRTFTIMGDTVNLAARLMAAAHPGEVYSTAGMLDHSRTAFACEPLEPFMVKGKAEPVQAYQVGTPTGPKESVAIGALPFRGRDVELSALLESFKSTCDGHGHSVLVEGERGTGKSRLTSELVSWVSPATILLLQGEPYGEAIPYLPLRAPLRKLFGLGDAGREESGRWLAKWVRRRNPALLPFLPFLATIVDAEVEPTEECRAVAPEFVRDRVADVVISALDSFCPTPLLIVSEDAHWFDDTTSAICARLSAAGKERAWMICSTRRPGSGGYSPSSVDLRIELAPLGDESARELVEAATDAAPLRPQERDGIVARAGGNPLFLEELLRIVRETQVDGLPDSLDAVAMREIDSLSAAPRRVLLLASVLGHSFDEAVLAQLLTVEKAGAAGDPLEGLEGQLHRERGGRIRFRHALLREAAYQTLPFRTRLAMHRQVGEAIESGASRLGEVAPLLSLHFHSAQDWERTWRYARLAAETSSAGHAPSEAAAHLERAVAASRQLPGAVTDRDRSALLSELGHAYELLGDYERADSAYRRAMLPTALDPITRAEIVSRRAFLRFEYLGRPSAAIRMLRSAQDRLARSDVPREGREATQALLSAHEAYALKRRGHFSEAIACSRRAAQLAERTNHSRALATSLSVLDQCLFQTGRFSEATHFEQALELYQSLGDHVSVAVTLNNLAVAAHLTSQWELAGTRFQESIDAFRKAGDLAGAAFGQLNLGDLLLGQGLWQEAEAMLAAARRTLTACGYLVVAALATMHLGRARVLLGDDDSGLALLQSSASSLEAIGGPVERMESRARLADALMLTGRLDEARTALQGARALEHLSDETPISSLVDRVELSLDVAAGDMAAAAASIEPFLARARRLEAEHEVMMLLVLAEEIGVGRDDAELDLLRTRLGVVQLPPASGTRLTVTA